MGLDLQMVMELVVFRWQTAWCCWFGAGQRNKEQVHHNLNLVAEQCSVFVGPTEHPTDGQSKACGSALWHDCQFC